MSKKNRFRRVKVSNMGYVSGKRLQGFRAHEKAQRERPAEQRCGDPRGGEQPKK